jgi:hypothetical protein
VKTKKDSPRLVQRRLSARLLKQLQRKHLTLAECLRIFNQLLQLDYGVWQFAASTGRCTFRAFVRRVIRLTVRQASARGVPRSIFELEAMENEVLGEFFSRWRDSNDSVRRWLIRACVKEVRVRTYNRASVWLQAPLGPAATRKSSRRSRATRSRGQEKLRRPRPNAGDGAGE